MVFQLLQNMACGHIKGTGHVFYMATPSHATESLANPTIFLLENCGHSEVSQDFGIDPYIA